MPHTLTRTFRIRSYECDAYGHLNNVNYLRFMQETAFDASAAAGYDGQRYTEMDRLWLIRESGVEFLAPLRYGDTIEIKTWISDFRRVTSRRRYEFRLASNGQVAAEAYTDWVFLTASTGQPTSIPDEMGTAFFPEGLPASFLPRQPFPKAPPPPPGIFTLQRRVEWGDIDGMQHVNNAVYMKYVSECGVQMIAAHGWPWKRMAEHGFGIYLRSLRIQYLQPALLDDDLEIATWASNMRRSTAERHYTIRRADDGALLAQAHTLGVWVNLETGRPIRIPAQFATDFAGNVVPGSPIANPPKIR